MSIQLEGVDTVEVGYDEFCGALAARDLQALWSIRKRLLSPAPVPLTLPWMWKWSTIYPLAQRAGEIITIDRGGDRRVLAFANPGLSGLPYTSTTLWGAIQYLGPGETAPAHRHTPAAVRFVMVGEGVYTTVDGDACTMEAGDLVLTPNWTWHDHNSTGESSMVWFDGLDLPIVAALESVFFENYPDEIQPIEGHDLSEQLFSASGLAAAGAKSPASHSPLLRYPYGDTDRALEALHEREGGHLVELDYLNPLTGAAVTATVGASMLRLYPGGGRSPSKRKTGSSVYVVFRGRGQSVIAGQRFEWSPGDVFVTPSWAPVDHEAYETADLFCLTDAPVQRALALYREEILPENQAVESTFTPREGSQ